MSGEHFSSKKWRKKPSNFSKKEVKESDFYMNVRLVKLSNLTTSQTD